MIWEWKTPARERNYGDALWELVGASNDALLKSYARDATRAHCLIGSYIDNTVMSKILRSGYTPVFHNCGWRGNELDPELVAQSIFMGCRGPATQRALRRAGKDIFVTADPGRYVPLVVKTPPRKKDEGETIFVPNILDSRRDTYRASNLGVDTIVSPVVRARADIVTLTQRIASADFVLAGAMHAAIVAHAYSVPFAFYNGGTSRNIDCPAKWDDWLEWLEIDTAQQNHWGHSWDGINWWEKHRHGMNR